MTTMTVIRQAAAPLTASDGTIYDVNVCGEQRGNVWHGWVEFQSGSVVLRTPTETTQSKFSDLEYWASGLDAVYFEGAFRRAGESIRP